VVELMVDDRDDVKIMELTVDGDEVVTESSWLLSLRIDRVELMVDAEADLKGDFGDDVGLIIDVLAGDNFHVAELTVDDGDDVKIMELIVDDGDDIDVVELAVEKRGDVNAVELTIDDGGEVDVVLVADESPTQETAMSSLCVQL